MKRHAGYERVLGLGEGTKMVVYVASKLMHRGPVGRQHGSSEGGRRPGGRGVLAARVETDNYQASGSGTDIRKRQKDKS